MQTSQNIQQQYIAYSTSYESVQFNQFNNTLFTSKFALLVNVSERTKKYLIFVQWESFSSGSNKYYNKMNFQPCGGLALSPQRPALAGFKLLVMRHKSQRARAPSK